MTHCISIFTGMPADGQDLERRLEERITEFTLPSNGMHFIVLERHKAPIVSCNTYANVGAFDEEDGKTGASHWHNTAKGAHGNWRVSSVCSSASWLSLWPPID